MKKVIIIVAVIAVVVFGGLYFMKKQTKSHSPEAVAVYKNSGFEVQVNYCQPYKKDRVIFGQLLPYGQVWRTGANEATEISFNKDVLFVGQPVKAGKYTLFTIPDKKAWTIILNKETGQWGLSYDEKQDLLRVKVPPATQSDVTEMFTIGFQGSDDSPEMQLMWDQTRVSIPIQAQ